MAREKGYSSYSYCLFTDCLDNGKRIVLKFILILLIYQLFRQLVVLVPLNVIKKLLWRVGCAEKPTDLE